MDDDNRQSFSLRRTCSFSSSESEYSASSSAMGVSSVPCCEERIDSNRERAAGDSRRRGTYRRCLYWSSSVSFSCSRCNLIDRFETHFLSMAVLLMAAVDELTLLERRGCLLSGPLLGYT